ncbi:MAG TPA: hypothetical protein VFL53_12170 [Pseudolabrys sp.]|nr:hypothetical protein [Pseudolabrys sp.]
MRVLLTALKAIALLCLLPFGGLQRPIAEAYDSFRNLLSVYRYEVMHRLKRIYETGDRASDRDRFIAVTVPGHLHGYVQCIFHDHQTQIYCEASSGFYCDKEGEPRTFHQPQQRVDALARDIDDSAGNFKMDFGVGNPHDFNAIAAFILRALHDGYDARGDMNLRFNARFAPRAPCMPVS